jgi:hypothetical protein
MFSDLIESDRRIDTMMANLGAIRMFNEINEMMTQLAGNSMADLIMDFISESDFIVYDKYGSPYNVGRLCDKCKDILCCCDGHMYKQVDWDGIIGYECDECGHKSYELAIKLR